MKRLRPLIILFALAAPALAQTWFKVANEGDTISTTTNITYRFGAASGITVANDGVASKDCSAVSCWSATTTTTTPFNGLVTTYANFPFADPAYGLVKEVDVLETAYAQTVTVNGNAVTVPGLTPPKPYTPTFTPGTVYTITFTNVAAITTSPAAGLLSTFNIPPYQFVAGVLQNFTMTTTVGGVPFVCTFGAITAPGVISMNCIPAPQSASN